MTLIVLGATDVRKIHAIILSACLVLGAATAYAHGSTKDKDTEALGMMAKGQNWMATNVFKRLVAKKNSPLNRFNLATGYQRTGRFEQARSIYRDLVAEGQTTNAYSTPAQDAPARVFNVAEEAASRLLYFDWLKSENTRQAMAKTSRQGAFSADAAGVQASVTVGGSTYGDVSDEAATALDGQASQAQ